MHYMHFKCARLEKMPLQKVNIFNLRGVTELKMLDIYATISKLKHNVELIFIKYIGSIVFRGPLCIIIIPSFKEVRWVLTNDTVNPVAK